MKAKTGAESPPAPSSSALAATDPIEDLKMLRRVLAADLGNLKAPVVSRKKAEILDDTLAILARVIAALESQATDKAAAVEKVKALPTLRARLTSSTDTGSGQYLDRNAVLAILTDSQPKEEEQTG